MTGLIGKRVLVTRPRQQAVELAEMLASLGAVPVLFPTIEIAAPKDTASLDRAIRRLDTYRWVVFTSANGVAAFWQRLFDLKMTKDIFKGVKVAAIGPKTARALRAYAIESDFTPEEYRAEAILAGMGDVRGQKVLLPRTDIARKALFDGLVLSGAIPEEIPVYQVRPAQVDPQALAELEKGIDVATFTSSSTVRSFLEIAGGKGVEVLKCAIVACIGPITAETAREKGLKVQVVAKEYTSEGLVEALVGYFSVSR